MGLDPGGADAADGMAKAIYDQINTQLQDLQAPDALPVAQDTWKKLAFAISTGVIQHIKDNMEIVGVQTTGDVAAAISGPSGPAPPGPHAHPVTLTASQSRVTFTQSNDGRGHVK
jgi:hypothetical protein